MLANSILDFNNTFMSAVKEATYEKNTKFTAIRSLIFH